MKSKPSALKLQFSFSSTTDETTTPTSSSAINNYAFSKSFYGLIIVYNRIIWIMVTFQLLKEKIDQNEYIMIHDLA